MIFSIPILATSIVKGTAQTLGAVCPANAPVRLHGWPKARTVTTFAAPVHVQRVQAWRLAHPACSRAKPTRSAKGWIDQALVQRGLIDRCDARAVALYLFLVTVADAQGLSYYGAATLAKRLHLSEQELGGTRLQLIELDLIAYPAPLYQVLSLHEAAHTNRPAGHRA